MKTRPIRGLFRPFFWFIGFIFITGCTIRQNSEQSELVYWSADYQEYLVVKDGKFVRYQWDPAFCDNAAAGLLPMVGLLEPQIGQFLLLQQNPDLLLLKRLTDTTLVSFVRTPFLPESCSYETVGSNLTQLLSLNFNLKFFGRETTAEIYSRALSEALTLDRQVIDSSEEAITLFEYLSGYIRQTQDKHAFIYARDLGLYTSVYSPKPVVLALPELSAQKAFCNQKIYLGLTKAGERYIRITELIGFVSTDHYELGDENCISELVRTLNKKSLTDNPNIIVDLRNNGGGSLYLAAMLHSALTGYSSEPFAYLDQQVVTADPIIGLNLASINLSVLVNGNTASAAEHLALALKRSGARIYGQVTAGMFSPTIVKTLPNGWFYGFSMYSKIRDKSGELVPENSGITPDCIIEDVSAFPASVTALCD